MSEATCGIFDRANIRDAAVLRPQAKARRTDCRRLDPSSCLARWRVTASPPTTRFELTKLNAGYALFEDFQADLNTIKWKIPIIAAVEGRPRKVQVLNSLRYSAGNAESVSRAVLERSIMRCCSQTPRIQQRPAIQNRIRAHPSHPVKTGNPAIEAIHNPVMIWVSADNTVEYDSTLTI